MKQYGAFPSFWEDTKLYASRMRLFARRDWLVYVLWIGMMFGLFGAIITFLLTGALHGVEYKSYVWNVPLGTFIFVMAIAFDTIGHRTIYKEAIQEGENLVHHITIFAGITSVLGLCLAYQYPDFLRIPVLVLAVLSFVYSLIDEVLHWRRYLNQKSDRVEMWSHFFIFVGHLIMTLSWWRWYDDGYPGVAETLNFLPYFK